MSWEKLSFLSRGTLCRNKYRNILECILLLAYAKVSSDWKHLSLGHPLISYLILLYKVLRFPINLRGIILYFYNLLIISMCQVNDIFRCIDIARQNSKCLQIRWLFIANCCKNSAKNNLFVYFSASMALQHYFALWKSVSGNVILRNGFICIS